MSAAQSRLIDIMQTADEKSIFSEKGTSESQSMDGMKDSVPTAITCDSAMICSYFSFHCVKSAVNFLFIICMLQLIPTIWF